MESPRFIRNTAGLLLKHIPKEYLFGAKYREIRKLIKETEFLSKEKLSEIQFIKLKGMLTYAYINVPYYQNLFNQYGIKVDKIQTYDDFRKIPFLDKEKIRQNFKNLQSINFKKCSRVYGTTGGTSGEPLGFFIDRCRSQIEWAYLTSIWERTGFKINDKRLVLRGEVIKSKHNKSWFYDPLLNQLSIATFRMNDDNLFEYVNLIQDFKPDFIHGYPSAIMILAQYIRNNNIKLKFKLKGIIGISETIIQAQRKYIEDIFKTRFFSFYGHSEKCILAGECEESNYYHVEPLYGFCELIDSDGNQVDKDGHIGELVGTGFINHAMPFIRYKTSDIAEYTSKKCECGRDFTLLPQIDGRKQDVMILDDDTKTPITAFVFGQHFHAFKNILKMQLVQEQKGKLTVRIIKGPNYNEADEKELVRKMVTSVNHKIKINIKYVDFIETTVRGKHRFFINKIIDNNN